MRDGLVEPLINGLASHHAGLLPGWKGLVEGLFQQGGVCLACHSLCSRSLKREHAILGQHTSVRPKYTTPKLHNFQNLASSFWQ